MKKKQYTFKRAGLSILVMSILGFMFVLWISLFYPRVENSLSVWMMFVIFYVLVVSFWLALFVGMFGRTFKALKGAFVLSVISAILDLFYPPYAVGLDGSLPTASNAGYRGSIDYTIGYYGAMFGIHGIALFLFVYLLMPLFALATLLFILRPKQFIQSVKSAV